MHYIQQAILNTVAKQGKSRFSNFDSLGLSNDHLNFHLKQLIRLNYLVKSNEGYVLTPTGSEFSGRLNKDTSLEISMPKVSISLGISKEMDGEKHFLLSERLIGQSRGQIAWHTTKVLMGEPLFEACARCLKNETGLEGDFSYQGITRVIRKENDQFEIDVVVLCFKVSNVSGKLIQETEQVRNFWISLDEAKKLTNTVVGFEDDLEAFANNKSIYNEYIN